MKHTHQVPSRVTGGNGHAHERSDEETDVLAELIQEARDLVGEADCPWFSCEPQLLAAAAADRVRSRRLDDIGLSPLQRGALERLKDIESLR